MFNSKEIKKLQEDVDCLKREMQDAMTAINQITCQHEAISFVKDLEPCFVWYGVTDSEPAYYYRKICNNCKKVLKVYDSELEYEEERLAYEEERVAKQREHFARLKKA